MSSPTLSSPRSLKVSPIEGHRIWARTYDADPNPVLVLERRTVCEKLGDLRGKLFLDVACGTGRWLVEARVRGARVLGVDLCPEMLMQAGKKPGLSGRLALADVESLPVPDASAEMAMCAFALGYVQSPGTLLRELARCVRPGCSIFITDFHPAGQKAGWTRSFRSGGQVYEIAARPYTIAMLMEAARSAGLELGEVWEPCFGEPERDVFRAAGREALFGGAREIPAVLITRWHKRLSEAIGKPVWPGISTGGRG